MKIPWRRPAGPSPEAIAARERAEDALDRARNETPRVRALADSLREVQRRNHLAEAFEYTLRGRP